MTKGGIWPAVLLLGTIPNTIYHMGRYSPLLNMPPTALTAEHLKRLSLTYARASLPKDEATSQMLIYLSCLHTKDATMPPLSSCCAFVAFRASTNENSNSYGEIGNNTICIVGVVVVVRIATGVHIAEVVGVVHIR